MITKVKQNFISLIITDLIDDKFAKFSKSRKYFITQILWLFTCIKGNGSTTEPNLPNIKKSLKI